MCGSYWLLCTCIFKYTCLRCMLFVLASHLVVPFSVDKQYIPPSGPSLSYTIQYLCAVSQYHGISKLCSHVYFNKQDYLLSRNVTGIEDNNKIRKLQQLDQTTFKNYKNHLKIAEEISRILNHAMLYNRVRVLCRYLFYEPGYTLLEENSSSRECEKERNERKI